MQHKWFIRTTPMPYARARLFCLPYAGGSATVFQPWVQALSPTVEVTAVELPGRGTRLAERPYTRLQPLIGALTEAIWPYLDKPFALFGHSMGALAAFELTRNLRARYGLTPTHLFVSAHRAPHLPDTDPFTDQLPDQAFLAKIQSLGGTDAHLFEHYELVELMLPILRADFAVCKQYAYVPSMPLECPITGFYGEDDPSVSREQMEGWRAHTVGRWTLRTYPGGHFFIRSAQAQMLADIGQMLTSDAPVMQCAL